MISRVTPTARGAGNTQGWGCKQQQQRQELSELLSLKIKPFSLLCLCFTYIISYYQENSTPLNFYISSFCHY